MLIKRLVVLAALCVSGLAVARSMPIFGVARFGEGSAAFGGVAVPVPFHAPMGNHPACCRAVGCCVPHANQGDLK